jgi:hypothetical protein
VLVDEASSAKDRVAREADRLFGLATESFDSIPRRTLSRSSFLRQMKGSRAFLEFFWGNEVRVLLKKTNVGSEYSVTSTWMLVSTSFLSDARLRAGDTGITTIHSTDLLVECAIAQCDVEVK